MNKKTIIALFILAGEALLPFSAQASFLNTNSATQKTLKYNLSLWNIPSAVNGETWYDDGGSYQVSVVPSTSSAWADITVNGTAVGINSKGATIYATNNPGIGIAYQVNYDPPSATTPQYAWELPNKITFTTTTSGSGYMHVKYMLVRLTENVPAGAITQAPDVTLNYHNPTGSGYPDISFLALSGISSQPKMTSCTINAPSTITLPTLYGNKLTSGAQEAIDIPTMTLTNCPGAISGIKYAFKATYGTQDASNGIIKTVTGDGYAKNVYIQLQNADGSPAMANGTHDLENYNGSGNYDLPDYKIGYYIYDENNVTAGNVKSAIQLEITYN